MKLYPIFKRENAMKLREMGNPLIDASSNNRNPKYVIYYFEDTEKLHRDFDSLQK